MNLFHSSSFIIIAGTFMVIKSGMTLLTSAFPPLQPWGCLCLVLLLPSSSASPPALIFFILEGVRRGGECNQERRGEERRGEERRGEERRGEERRGEERRGGHGIKQPPPCPLGLYELNSLSHTTKLNMLP